MANVRNANTDYVDTAANLNTTKNRKIAYIVLTATANSAILVLADVTGPTIKIELRIDIADRSQVFDFSDKPMIFPNGVRAHTVTNCVATLVYTENGGGSN